MRPAAPLLAFVCLAALSAGCLSQNKDKLDNTTWSSEKTTIRNVELPEGARVIEFEKKDQQLKLTYKLCPNIQGGESRTLRGTYAYNSGHYVTLTFDEKLNDRKQHVEQVVLSPDGEQLTMTDSDGTSVTFKKVKPAPKETD